MATVNSALSFQGLSSGIQTDALVSAILAQEGARVTALKTRQDLLAQKTSSLASMKTSMNDLVVSLAALKDKLDARAVTSTDVNNTYVSATGTGALAGSYDLSVAQTATKARISSTLNNFTGTSSNNSVLSFTSSTAKTTTGTVAFNITANDGLGNVSGTFTVSGTSYVLTSNNGSLTGTAGTPLEGLNVSVTGAATGSGTLKLAAEPSNLAVADPAAAIFVAGTGTASFAIKGTDGVIKAFDLVNNSLNGLRDAINASGAAVTAAVVNTGSGANPYQLVLTAKDTGTGSTSGVITLADVTASGAATVNASLGITTGVLSGTIAAPTALSGGLTSDASGVSAQDALFTLNGVQLTRQTNIVKDAADGMIFTLKQGGQTGTTTLTVAQDKTVATAGMQDVIIKLNALLSGYKAASTATKNTDGSIKEAPLSGDSNIRSMISRIKAAFLGPSAGLASTSTYQVTSQLGIKTNVDGTLSLDSTAFQNAIANDPAAAKRLFTFSGESTNGVVAFTGAGSTTATGSVQFVIKADPGTGALSGTFTGTANGPITVPVTNGVLLGTGDLDGLTLTVTGAGSGTLNLIRGAGQATSDLLSSATSAGSGSIQSALANIQTQNRSLTTQIDLGQAILDRRKLVLQKQFSQMETIVAQMRAAAGSLTGA